MKIKLSFSSWFNRTPIITALIAQLMSLIIIKLFIQIVHTNLPIFWFVFLQAMFSAIITQLVFKLPKWFFSISILFPILISVSFSYVHVSSWIYGFLFIFFALTFSHTLKERVPLYLTNKKTHDALKKIIYDKNATSFLDLGSGLGGVVRAMAETKVKSVGVESAPVLWVLSGLFSLLTFKGKILRQNIWDTKLSDYDIVYAFLSPAIMDKLYIYAKAEMNSGSFFISNSFEVVGIKPFEVWQLDDGRQTILYFYKI